jgi:N-acetyl-gamma-glutamyl-phosphate reductase
MSHHSVGAKTIRTAIVGASGYSGLELVRILSAHPWTEVVHLYSSPQKQENGTSAEAKASLGTPDADFLFRTKAKVPLKPFDERELLNSSPDVVFFATPNETSNELIPRYKKERFKVIDLSGSFRLKDAAQYPHWYGFSHAAPELLSDFVYGLPELNATSIASAQRVANPGCYATSVLLPLLPLAQLDWMDKTSAVVCDSKSGVSGAGKQPTSNTHFCEVSESFKAYSVFTHRHLPEIEQNLGLNGGQKLMFTPHLIPINRGILSTLYIKLRASMSEETLLQAFSEFYAKAPFVRIMPAGELPQVKWVTHTNFCDIGVRIEPGTPWLILVSCIDNLVKGAAGQAIQNMNLMFGLDETAGLE